MSTSETPLPGGAAIDSPPPGGGQHYPPSQGQDLKPDQLDVLVYQVVEDQRHGLDDAISRGIRAAYRVGYAAALGYQITVTDGGVQISDRIGPDWVTMPADQHAREQAVLTAARAYSEACGSDWHTGLQARFDALQKIQIAVDRLGKRSDQKPVDLVDRSSLLPDVWAGIRHRVEGGPR